MDKEKALNHPKWKDPPKARVIGHHNLTEKQRNDGDRFEEIVKNGDYEKLLKGEIKL